MKGKIVAITAAAVIAFGFFGLIPSYIYNNFHRESSTSDEVYVDWEKLYPFEMSESVSESAAQSSKKENAVDRYRRLVENVKEKAEDGVNLYFPLRTSIIEANGKILKSMGIKLITGSDTVVDLGEGYLTQIDSESNDMSVPAENLISFSKWLKERKIGFLYVQAPFKIGVTEQNDLAGYTDYNHKDCDAMIGEIRDKVPLLDLRENMLDDFSGNKEQFYKTDHHWLPSTGLWATNILAEKLNEEYDYGIDTRLFQPDRFRIDRYDDWLLGSLGKKVTLGYTKAEDLDIYYPDYGTKFHVEVPSLNISKTGDFYDTLIYHRLLEKKNYYDWDAYWAYGYGNRALIQIDNLEIEGGKKILMLKDSFANVVYPFLALGVNEISVIDLRYFSGSLKTYIKEYEPDTVVFLCNPSSLPDGADSSNIVMFDFR